MKRIATLGSWEILILLGKRPHGFRRWVWTILDVLRLLLYVLILCAAIYSFMD